MIQLPRVSVVLPVRNAEDSLAASLESTLAQTLSAIEVIVIDDGSTDDSAGVAEAMAARDHRLSVVRMPASGIAEALNHGLSLARAPHIARMDADDMSLPRRFEVQSRYLDEHPEIGLVGCLVRYGGDTETQAGYAEHVTWANSIVTTQQIETTRFVEAALPHPSVMFRRELTGRFGRYRPGPFPEDYDLWLRWLEAGVKMAKVDEELLVWSDPPGRLSRVDSRYDPEAFVDHKTPFLERWLEQNNQFHPDIVVWGAGRVSRRRAHLLEEQGSQIKAYVDIDPDKIGQRIARRPVWAPADLPPPGNVFVVSYVGSRGARVLIEEDLRARGYRVGADYMMAA